MSNHAVSQVLESPGPGPRAGALARKFAAIGAATDIPFAVVLANGAVLRNGKADPAFTLTFRTPRAQRRLLLFGYVGLLESYFDGSLDVDGDLALAFRAGIDSGHDRIRNPLVALRNRWHEWRHSNRSLPQAKANARFHYGLGKAFYEPWLDTPAMMYTCAYWSEGTTTLEEAQRNKMDHVCRKVRLQPGETFVDVGCGWGGLMFHAWEHYGAIGHRDQRHHRAGRGTAGGDRAPRARRQRCAWSKRDFREMPGQYDKLLSIGTLEHAGPDQLPEVVQRARRRDEAGRPRRHPLHRPRRSARHRVLHPQLHLSRRLDPEPRAGARRDGALRARGARRREPAPPLRVDARLLGRALRPQLGARSTRSTRFASTSGSAASGARTCGRARRSSAARTSSSTCSR